MCFFAMKPEPKGDDPIPYTYCPHIMTEFEGRPVLWSRTGTIGMCSCCWHYMCGKCYSHHPKPENAPHGILPCHWDTRRFIFMVERFCDLPLSEQGRIWQDPAARAKFYYETPI